MSRTVNGVTTYLYYDGWNLIEERDASGNLLAKYVHGAQVDELLSLSNASGTFYYNHDALGSVTHLTDGSGALVEKYTYDAFGNPTIFGPNNESRVTSLVANRFAFTGREWLAELGLNDYRFRVYSPAMGRFLQTDPLRFGAGDKNLYRYVKNSPITEVDPYGLLTKEQCQALRQLLQREKDYGTQMAASMSSVTVGDGLMQPFNSNNVPPIDYGGRPLEVDWLVDINVGTVRLPGLTRISGLVSYVAGKSFWSGLRKLAGAPIQYAWPFQDAGEVSAFALSSKPFQSVFDRNFMDRECPDDCGTD